MQSPAAGILMLIGGAAALTCYQSDLETGNRELVTRDDWQYCGWADTMLTNDGVNKVYRVDPPSHFGVNDAVMNLTIANRLLQRDVPQAAAPLYNVLSYCVIEKFTVDTEPEYMLLCVCAHDGCNKGRTLQQYAQYNVLSRPTTVTKQH